MRTDAWRQVLYFSHLYGAIGLGVLGFGTVLSSDQLVPLTTREYALMAAATVAFLTLPWSARPLWARSRNEWLFSTLVPLVVGAVGLVVIDRWAVTRLPPWPARVLHGVPPSTGPEGWGRVQSLFPTAMRNNSWGQRDVEHALSPDPQVPRLAFVGDSMLEESSLTPLPALVQQRMGASVEIVNLGVSATNTEAYTWRTKAVALPLGSRHVVCFFYTGNDFLIAEPWSLRRGFIDVPPADSFLGRWLPGVTGFLAQNAHVPVRAWLGPSPLHAREMATLAAFRTAGRDGLVEQLLGLYQGAKRDEVRRLLQAKDLDGFYADLMAPDMGLFRSFVLTYALSALAGEIPRDDRTGADAELAYTVRWLEKMKAVAEGAGAEVTYVLVPVSYDVDDRFVDTWAPLIDFRVERAYNAWRLDQLHRALNDRNLDVLDLTPVLANQRGAYLNFDTHWSTAGNDLVATAVARHLADRYARR